MYHLDPPGRIDPDSIMHYGTNPVNKCVIFFDQEPLHPDLNQSLFSEFSMRNIKAKKQALIVSERDSDNLDYTCKQWNLQPFYYFFHGWAALDWFRGYDRTWLIKPPEQRTITKTFFSANRIIGGYRQHRVLMLYWFQQLGLMHNWISASAVCPVEHTSIQAVAEHYQQHLPDIVDVVSQIPLPKLFPGEDQPRMSSCWLDQFEPCAESLVYHVTETIYHGRRLQLTEKTFKPIALGMPFVLSAPAGSLAYLKSYGFKSFDSVWDESYDSETDDLVRAEKVARLLSWLDGQDLQDVFEQCIPVIKHNWNWFYNGGFESVLWQELTDMLQQLDHFMYDLPSN